MKFRVCTGWYNKETDSVIPCNLFAVKFEQRKDGGDFSPVENDLINGFVDENNVFHPVIYWHPEDATYVIYKPQVDDPTPTVNDERMFLRLTCLDTLRPAAKHYMDPATKKITLHCQGHGSKDNRRYQVVAVVVGDPTEKYLCSFKSGTEIEWRKL